ncbi:MAG: hypothetical protein AABY22_18950 [Nanoarchaeota archaeon]
MTKINYKQRYNLLVKTLGEKGMVVEYHPSVSERYNVVEGKMPYIKTMANKERARIWAHESLIRKGKCLECGLLDTKKSIKKHHRTTKHYGWSLLEKRNRYSKVIIPTETLEIPTISL